MNINTLAVALIGAAILVFPTQAFAQPQYEIIDLGSFGGGTSYAYDINELGIVCGTAWTGSGNTHRGFYYDGTLHDIGVLPGYSSSEPKGINDLGQIVGMCPGSPSAAFMYSDGTITDVSSIGGDITSCMAINNLGQTVGSVRLLDGTFNDYHAFLYENGTMTDLGTLGGQNSWAFDINEDGLIVGRSRLASEAQHAFLYRNGYMLDLGTLSGGTQSEARAINNNAEVVGIGYTADGVYHAFVNKNRVMMDLGTLSGAYSSASDINDSGAIVGWSNTADVQHPQVAMLYENGVMYNLNDLVDSAFGWELTEAEAINNNGWIVGYGKSPTGETRAFLLVPEPASLALLAAGGLAMLRRKRR